MIVAWWQKLCGFLFLLRLSLDKNKSFICHKGTIMYKTYTLFTQYWIVFFLVLSYTLIGQNHTSLNEEIESQTKTDTAFIKMNDFPQVDVIGRKPSLLNRIPGSASLITNRTLYITQPLSGNEIFKKVTGIN